MNWIAIVGIFLAPIIISPVAMAFIRHQYENGSPKGMFDFRTQSWAFLFGDSVALPVALSAALYAVQKDAPEWMYRWWWLLLAVATATIATFGFRTMDKSGYIASGNADRLHSPTKLWHDFVVYPILGFPLFYLGIPAIATLSLRYRSLVG